MIWPGFSVGGSLFLLLWTLFSARRARTKRLATPLMPSFLGEAGCSGSVSADEPLMVRWWGQGKSVAWNMVVDWRKCGVKCEIGFI